MLKFFTRKIKFQGRLRMKEKLMKFMYGRYGNDELNQFLFKLVFVSLVISLLSGRASFLGDMFYFLALIMVVFIYFRMFSKNIFARNRENEKYLNFFKPLSRWLELKLMNRQDPSHKYFSCPNCKQKVRVPKGHGKVIVTCPSCQNKFEKRT